jgi:hypothetical protein
MSPGWPAFAGHNTFFAAEYLSRPSMRTTKKCRVLELKSGFLARASHAFNRAIF